MVGGEVDLIASTPKLRNRCEDRLIDTGVVPKPILDEALGRHAGRDARKHLGQLRHKRSLPGYDGWPSGAAENSAEALAGGCEVTCSRSGEKVQTVLRAPVAQKHHRRLDILTVRVIFPPDRQGHQRSGSSADGRLAKSIHQFPDGLWSNRAAELSCGYTRRENRAGRWLTTTMTRLPRPADANSPSNAFLCALRERPGRSFWLAEELRQPACS